MYKIYMLEFPNEKKYIGCTKKRFNYRTGLNGSQYRAKTIKAAIKEFGWENIKKSIIKDNLTYEEAKFYEDFYINQYKTKDINFGYNKKKGGGFSKTQKQYKHIMTPLKQKWIDSLKGKPLSKEHKQNIREGHLKRLNQVIIQYDLENNVLRKWNSLCEIQKECGFKKQLLSICCILNETKKTLVHTAYGYKWKKEKKS